MHTRYIAIFQPKHDSFLLKLGSLASFSDLALYASRTYDGAITVCTCLMFSEQIFGHVCSVA